MSKATEYGSALYELASEEGLENVIEEEFAEIVTVFDRNKDFAKLLTNPRIPISERTGVIDNVFKQKTQPYLLSLLKILTEKRDVLLTTLIFKEYRNKYYKDKNILPVKAISAVALTDQQKRRIIDNLEKSMNKTIILENKVDEACIGGIRLEYQGYMIDASIKNRFRKLQNDLKNADYSQAEV